MQYQKSKRKISISKAVYWQWWMVWCKDQKMILISNKTKKIKIKIKIKVKKYIWMRNVIKKNENKIWILILISIAL